MKEIESDPRQRAAATKRERTKANLIEAATTLFNQRGYEATSVEDIATEAETSVATAYNYFPSKDTIPRQCLGIQLVGLIDSTDQDLEAGTHVIPAVARHIKDGTLILRKNRGLLMAYMGTHILHQNQAGQYVGGSFELGSDMVVWDKLSGQLLKLIQRAMIEGEVQPNMEKAKDISDYHTKGLVMRVINYPYEDEAQTIEFATNQLLAALYMDQVVIAFKMANQEDS